MGLRTVVSSIEDRTNGLIYAVRLAAARQLVDALPEFGIEIDAKTDPDTTVSDLEKKLSHEMLASMCRTLGIPGVKEKKKILAGRIGAKLAESLLVEATDAE